MPAKNSHDEHVESYRARYSSYSIFAQRLRDLLINLLEENGIRFHIIESRAKSPESFRDKILRPGKDYKSPLSEISDLCGCRIITYYSDDTKLVGNILESEFTITEKEFSHSYADMDVDRFGYISDHYIIKIDSRRSSLPEWKAFSEMRAEIQVRTVIQHAWSAVSHALQYKQEASVPSALRRRLHRIAGLFELADEEFITIRSQREQIRKSTMEVVAGADLNVPLSVTGIEEVIKTWPSMKAARKKARAIGYKFGTTAENSDSETISCIYNILEVVGIKSISGFIDDINSCDIDILEGMFTAATGTSWEISDTFLICLMLVGKHKNDISIDLLVSSGCWDRKFASKVLGILND